MGLPVTAAYIVLATLSAPALAGMITDLSLARVIAEGALPAGAQPVLMLADPEAAARAVSGAMTLPEARALLAGLPLEVVGPLRALGVGTAATTAALLSAHMIIFWLSQDSNITPPVCLAAFTAAAIAKAPAMATGFTSWKIAKGLYVIPLLFALTPILSGDAAAALTVFGCALVGLYGLAAGLQGWMEHRLSLPVRGLALAAGAAAIWPAPLWVNLAGVAATLALLGWSVMAANRRTPAAA
jgi:TRAP-type uncharacterized transport system fused permease subunit